MATINRGPFNALIDDDGSGTSGTPWNKPRIKDVLLDPIDAALATATPGGSTTQVQFNDAGVLAGDAGLTFNKTTDRLTAGALTTGAASTYVNDTSNVKMTTGVTINQGAATDEAISLKSSHVGHTLTDEMESDSYARLKLISTSGGLKVSGINDTAGLEAFTLEGIVFGAPDTSKTVNGRGCVQIDGYRDNGTTGFGSVAAGANLLVIRNGTQTRFIFQGDGTSFQDIGTAWTNFDTENDTDVLNLLAAWVTRPDDPIRALFADWLQQSRATLERLGLVVFNDADGHHFVNMTRLTMLLVGAARQTGARLTALEATLADVQRRLGPA